MEITSLKSSKRGSHRFGCKREGRARVERKREEEGKVDSGLLIVQARAGKKEREQLSENVSYKKLHLRSRLVDSWDGKKRKWIGRG